MSVICAVLRQDGHTVLPAATASEAIRLADEHAAQIDILITDHRVDDGKTGSQVASYIQERRPAMRVLHTTGQIRDNLQREGNLSAAADFLQKPFMPKQLREKLTEMLR